jgi:hypothetical protein
VKICRTVVSAECCGVLGRFRPFFGVFTCCTTQQSNCQKSDVCNGFALRPTRIVFLIFMWDGFPTGCSVCCSLSNPHSCFFHVGLIRLEVSMHPKIIKLTASTPTLGAIQTWVYPYWNVTPSHQTPSSCCLYCRSCLYSAHQLRPRRLGIELKSTNPDIPLGTRISIDRAGLCALTATLAILVHP